MSKPISSASSPSFASMTQAFFTEHLIQQRALSPRTVAAYRDAFVLFVEYAVRQLHKQPTEIRLAQVTPSLLLGFLDHLEKERGNSVRSRNARLAAIRAFLKFAAHRDIGSLAVVEHALGVPMKRFERPMIGFLTREEMLAIIGTPRDNWIAQRDHLLLAMLYNTGARVSEIIAVRVSDVILDGTAFVTLHGKGRKQRVVPLWHSTTKAIRTWLRANPTLTPMSPLIPNHEGKAMSRSNVTQRLALAVNSASGPCPSLKNRHISPHTLRHTTAMHLLQAGVDISVIALWLGHESPMTTHQYVEADLGMKERALAKVHEPEIKLKRYRAPDTLIEFLKSL